MTGASRVSRLRARLVGAKEARVAEVEALLEACGWKWRPGKGAHRVWTKPGRQPIVIPVHGTKVHDTFVIRQVLKATEGNGKAGSA